MLLMNGLTRSVCCSIGSESADELSWQVGRGWCDNILCQGSQSTQWYMSMNDSKWYVTHLPTSRTCLFTFSTCTCIRFTQVSDRAVNKGTNS